MYCLTKGKEKSALLLLFCLFVLKTSLGLTCKKENRSSSRCQDGIKTKDIHIAGFLYPTLQVCDETPELITLECKSPPMA